MNIYTTTITPEIASEWLAQNHNNRDVKRAIVEQYARDMAAGRWQVTGEAIKRDKDGNVLDGQHRLLAMVKSGTPIVTVVVDGLPAEAQVVIDSGKPRGGGDALKFKGAKSPNQLAAVAKLAVHWNRGDIRVSHLSLKPLSNAEIADAVDADPTLQTATTVGNRYAHKRSHPGIRAAGSAVAFAYWLIAAVAGHDDADEFLRDLAEMRTNGSGDPRHAALMRLNSAAENNEKLRNITQTYILVVAWNAHRQGRPLTIVKISANGKALPFPEPLG